MIDTLDSSLLGLIFIFFARIADVSIGTMRIILISRGYRYLAPVLGFFEVIIWLAAIGEVMKGIGSTASYLVYGAGFATGNYVGMMIESRIAIGIQAVRIITTEKIVMLPLVLRQEGYGATTIKGWGARGEVNIIFTIVPRKKVGQVMEIVRMFEPGAFITVEDVKSTSRGYFARRRNFSESLAGFITKKK